MPRRILLLITDLKIGGTPTVVRELAFRLAAEPGVYVAVACLDKWGPVADQLKARGVDVTALNAFGRMDFGVVGRLVDLVREKKIDTIFSFLIHANAVAAMAARSLPECRFFQSIQTTQSWPVWHFPMQHTILSVAEKIIVPSRSVAEAARERAGVGIEKIVIIPNAVDLADFARTSSKKQGNRIGFVGRLDPVKRVPVLVNAIAHLPGDYSLEIFGAGVAREEIETEVRRLNLDARVRFHGMVASPRGPLEKLDLMDLLVLPSEAEGFGLVLIEAMAAGVPVIGTNVPGIRDVIVNGVNGQLVKPEDPAALAAAILRVMGDVDLRDRLIAGGKTSVAEKYSWPRVYEEYRKVLQLPPHVLGGRTEVGA